MVTMIICLPMSIPAARSQNRGSSPASSVVCLLRRGMRNAVAGRPPYGYRLADGGPHPKPAEAADGKRLQLDPETAPVVTRIFADYLAGVGIYALAEKLFPLTAGSAR
jgi:hypothetical protein